MPHDDPRTALASPIVMFISAALFGYFGFTTQWSYTSGLTGQFLPYVAILDWTLKGSAIVFGLAGVLTVISPLMGNVIYALTSIVGAMLLFVVGVWDFIDKQHMVGLPPLVLLLFAAWNGYGGWTALQAIMRRPRGDDDEPVFGATG